MAVHWPCHVLKPRDVSFDIAPRSLAAPAALSGFGQVVASDAGLWKATFANIVVRSRQTVLAFRALGTLLEGRVNPVIVPLCRAWQPIVPGVEEADPVPHSDGAFFSDGTGYTTGTMSVQTTAAASVGAVSIPIALGWPAEIEAGQHFSIGDRLYRIRSVTWASDLAATLTFRPPLRDFVALGAYLEFDDPVCRMRLATDREMDLTLELHRFGQPTVNFVEDL